jgi:hypothetical protein
MLLWYNNQTEVPDISRVSELENQEHVRDADSLIQRAFLNPVNYPGF